MSEWGVGQGHGVCRAFTTRTDISFDMTCPTGQVFSIGDGRWPASGLALEGGC